jgi:hypothetical protein
MRFVEIDGKREMTDNLSPKGFEGEVRAMSSRKPVVASAARCAMRSP